jgi:uncharacterized protein involved in exopolysaccharide biosynthesis
MSDPIDDYADRLTQALRQRGIDDPRIIAEAREHLLDMVVDGRRRGLSLEEAEREAFERFGAPEIVAAHAVSEGYRPMSRLAAALDMMWHRKWWILAPAVVTALVTSIATSYVLPTRYRSQATIRVIAPRVPEDIASFVVNDRLRQERLGEVAQMVLSRTRLERIIVDLGLYDVTGSAPREDVITQMRKDLAISLLAEDSSSTGDLGGFRVSFDAAEPRVAMRVTERIASVFIEENLRDRQVLVEGVGQFLDSQIYDTRKRIVEYEQGLEKLRSERGDRPMSRADLLPYEVLQESYKNLLVKAEEARVASAVQRRMIGDQFKVVDQARLPERPVGPTRLEVSAAGGFVGLGLGLVMVGLQRRSTRSVA